MSLIRLVERPNNVSDYVDPSEQGSHNIERWLRTMLGQGALNLHVPKCFLQTVASVEELAEGQQYGVYILPIQGETASAEFWFHRTGPRPNQPG